MQTHLEPQQNHGDSQHGGITNRPLLITGRYSTKLLQAVNQSLHLIALAIKLSIEGAGRLLVLLSRDRRPNTSPMQVLPILPKRIAFIPRNPLRANARAANLAPDCALFQKLLSHGDLVLLAGS